MALVLASSGAVKIDLDFLFGEKALKVFGKGVETNQFFFIAGAKHSSGHESLRCEDSNPPKHVQMFFPLVAHTSTRASRASRCAFATGYLDVA